MLLTLAVSGYRSLREIALPLEPLTVVTGANGSGKSSLYRSLRLLADVAQGNVIASLAQEGGLTSTLWAGPEIISRRMRKGETPVEGTVRSASVALKLGFATDDYGYAVDLGLPQHVSTAFARDPEIKCETLWIGDHIRRTNTLAERKRQLVQIRGEDHTWQPLITDLPPYTSMMTQAAAPGVSQELLILRDRMKSWRFYDALRTDRDAPARRPSVGTRTMALASDGADLAAAVQTIFENGDDVGFDRTIASAFPDASVQIDASSGLFELKMSQPGLLRPLSAQELSDGTLKFILLAAALLSLAPPPLLILNEPENSLHPDLIPPLARLISEVSTRSQVITVSHDADLVAALAQQGARKFDLTKSLGETTLGEEFDAPPWAWPKR